jgi:hypothetical protein
MFRTSEPNLDKPFHLWLTELCRAHDQKISMRTVMESEPKLQVFYRADEGFAQYADRHDIAVADLKIINSYFKWELERALEAEEFARIKAKGKADQQMEIALNALRGTALGENKDVVGETLRRLGISEDIVKRALEQGRTE